jgi:hypothetical protein
VQYLFRTQNPVVREHRVGSSPTSGTDKVAAKSGVFPCRSSRFGVLHPSLGDSFGDSEFYP